MRILVTRQMTLGKADATHHYRVALAKYLQQAGHDVTLEELVPVDWSSYGAVLCGFDVYNPLDSYHVHTLQQLRKSIASGQARICTDDDEYFTCLSLLRQLGEDDAGEFTHRLVLHDKPVVKQRQACQERIAGLESLSVAQSIKLPGPMWACFGEGLWRHAKRRPSKHRIAYAGHPKADRTKSLQDLPVEFLQGLTYAQYLAEYADSTAVAMLNSGSHRMQITPRFMESMQLSVCLWPEHVQVLGLKLRRLITRSQAALLAVAELSELDRMAAISEQTSAAQQLALQHMLEAQAQFKQWQL